GRIVVARTTLERLGSEAELAGVLAHEIAHIEGRHTAAAFYAPHADHEWLTIRRDAEAIADERAVVLLERSGYAPTAMGHALRAVLGVPDDPLAAHIAGPDDDHPAIADRLARVDELATGRGGFEGRAEFLAKLSGMIAGRDRRLGDRIGTTWVVASLGIAIPLHEEDELRAHDDVLSVTRGDTELTAYVIGGPWARELGASLEDRKTRTSPLGSVTSGIVPRTISADESPLGKLQRAIRSTLPQPHAGARVVIIDRPAGALVLELGGSKDLSFKVRPATDAELSSAEPARIVLEPAPSTGAIASIGICDGRLLDDPARIVSRGALVKCSDRTAAASLAGTARDGSFHARGLRAALQSHLARH
ncbi:MAG: M48 family metalloprotease, partial [Kofleriaceae bacterium]